MARGPRKSSRLLSLLKLHDKTVRDAFVDAHIRNGVAFQIRSLRRLKGWTQEELAAAAETQPTQVGRVENPDYSSHTVKVLRRIAAALDVALIVRFVPFSELLRWDSGPRNLSPDSFWDEMEKAKREDAKPVPDNVTSIMDKRPPTVSWTRAVWWKPNPVKVGEQTELFQASTSSNPQVREATGGAQYAATSP